jgi:hypothetical protein
VGSARGGYHGLGTARKRGELCWCCVRWAVVAYAGAVVASVGAVVASVGAVVAYVGARETVQHTHNGFCWWGVGPCNYLI